MRRRKSHRERVRDRARRHPGRAARMAADGRQRAEMARLTRLHAETSESALLGQIGRLRDELERARPMPKATA